VKWALIALAVVGCKKSAPREQAAPAATPIVAEAPKPVASAAVPPAPAVVDHWVDGDLTWSPTRKTAWSHTDTQLCTYGPDATGAAVATIACTSLVDATNHVQVMALGSAVDGVPVPVIVEDPLSADRHVMTYAVRLFGTEAVLARSERVYAAFAWSREDLDVLVDDPAGYAFERHRGAAPVQRVVVPAALPDNLAAIMGAGIVYYGVQQADGGHLRALRFDRDHLPKPETAADLGPAKHLEDAAPVCESAHRHAIGFDGKLAISVDDVWGAPFSLGIDSNLPPLLTCDDARVTSLAHVHEGIERVRCASADGAACVRQTVSERLTTEIADLGDLILSVFQPYGYPVRLHVGTPEGWDAATNDDRMLTTNGAESISITVVPGAGAALVLLDADGKTTAYHVDAHGVPTPLKK
jgi:hypothetical protein